MSVVIRVSEFIVRKNKKKSSNFCAVTTIEPEPEPDKSFGKNKVNDYNRRSGNVVL